MRGEVVSAELCLFQNSRIWTSQSGLTQFGHPDHSASSNSAERGPSGMEGAFESRRICVLTYIVCLGETTSNHRMNKDGLVEDGFSSDACSQCALYRDSSFHASDRGSDVSRRALASPFLPLAALPRPPRWVHAPPAGVAIWIPSRFPSPSLRLEVPPVVVMWPGKMPVKV